MPLPRGAVEALSGCRSCGWGRLVPILSLGETPLADGLLTRGQVERGEEERYPLEVVLCRGCTLVQLRHSVAPSTLFGRDYPYYSSFSDDLLRHSRDNALRLVERRQLGPDSLVVELASNDGYLLRNFLEVGVPVLGIDPAPGPAAAAHAAGVPTIVEFFGRELASSLRAAGRIADVVIANNVLAHVPDLNGFVAGISMLLAERGIASIEVPYVRDLVERREFDTIYHEHLCYFSVTALRELVRRHGMELLDVERLAIHGGSLRVTIGRNVRPSPRVAALLDLETSEGMDRPEYYRRFASDVRTIQRGLADLLAGLKADGGRIAAYGAAAKGAMLLNAAGVGPDLVDFVVDRNPHKQGKYMPGVHLPIRAPSALLEEMPSHVLLLAWNFREEIERQQAEYLARGGRFVVPIPKPAVL